MCVAALLSSPIFCSQPQAKQIKGKTLKALKVNCIKARKDAKERNKTRKACDFPPLSL